jgi:Domain of unknown function (DUF3883)
MPLKLAIKRLTASDLTFFATQYRQNPSVKQKAINLNADVFVDKLYPGLSDPSAPRWLKVNVSIYGPGLEGEDNLQRKIVKSERSKNWRLNGELVHNPDVDHTRFDSLKPGDFIVFGFSEGMIPTSLDAILIAKEVTEDKSIHTFLDQFLGTTGMLALSPSELEELVGRASPVKEHPIYKLTLDTGTLDTDLEDVALGGSQGREKLLSRPSSRKISREDLQKAKENADRTGRYGEQFVYEYLTKLQGEGKVRSFEWVSDDNSISPYDFRVNEETSVILVDVKSTQGEFKREIHVSLNELQRMASGPERYDIYRVFEIKEGTAQLHIARDVREFAKSVLKALEYLPSGVFSDSVSFAPTLLFFGPVETIELSEHTEEE